MKRLFKIGALALLLASGISPRAAAQVSAGDFNNSGVAKAGKGDLEGAIADYTRAIELDPELMAAYNNRGNARKDLGDFDEAIADYSRAISLDPKSAIAYSNRGGAESKNGQLDHALADSNRAIELDPSLAEAYGNRSLIKQARGDFDGAIADCDHAIALNPKIAFVYVCRGSAKTSKGDLDAAIADFNRATELDPKSADAYLSRANAETLARKWKEALADYRQYGGLPPSGSDAPLYRDYSQIYIWLLRARLGETDAASKDLSDFIAKRPAAARDDWVSKVAGHLLGSVTRDELMAASTTHDTKQELGWQCEGWYYSGMKALLSGDKKSAADCFHNCLATGQKDYLEYLFAEAELKALGE